MSDPAPTVATTTVDVTPSTVTTTSVSSGVSPGWKSTELYLSMFAMGAITWALTELIKLIPTLAANPAVPPWAVPLIGMAPVALAWLLKLAAGEYGLLRQTLKLGADSDPSIAPAIAAGAAAQGATDAAALAAVNK